LVERRNEGLPDDRQVDLDAQVAELEEAVNDRQTRFRLELRRVDLVDASRYWS
jgi:hypothetical protein